MRHTHALATIAVLVTLTGVTACSDDAKPLGSELGLSEKDTALCVALGADYRNNVGAMAVIGLPSLTVVKNLLPGAVSGDPVMRAIDGKLYIVNRSQNNITVIDPLTWKVEAQFSTGAGSNPQDIALLGSKAYVPLYDKGELQVWNLGDAARTAPQKTIDLSSYDSDGVPQANSIVISGGRAYVTLDLLSTENPPSPRGLGKVVVIDTATDTAVKAIDLKFKNPYDFMVVRGDKLIVSTFDDFSGQTGCLEQIAPGSDPKVLDCLVKNSDLNGIINSMAVNGGDTYVAVSRFDAMFNQEAEIHHIGPAGTLVGGPMTPAGQVPTDVAFSPSGHLVYTDAKAGGLRVLTVATSTELTTAPLDIGLPPAAANGLVCMER